MLRFVLLLSEGCCSGIFGDEGGEDGGGGEDECGGDVEGGRDDAGVVDEEIDGGIFMEDEGIELGGGIIQHGPVHNLCFFLSLEVLRPEHLTWSQPLHDVQRIAVLFSGRNFEQIVHGQVSGPGFCSIPARISNSWSS